MQLLSNFISSNNIFRIRSADRQGGIRGGIHSIDCLSCQEEILPLGGCSSSRAGESCAAAAAAACSAQLDRCVVSERNQLQKTNHHITDMSLLLMSDHAVVFAPGKRVRFKF